MKLPKLDQEQTVLVFQAGGALGAYQAGVYEELTRNGRQPTWVAGASIGAINAAIIAGNPPERSVDRLREFWDLVSTGSTGFSPWWEGHRQALQHFDSMVAATRGVPGFYAPRMPPPFVQPDGTPGALSLYDMAPLKPTLERLIDFDRIDDGPIRLSIVAVDVVTGDSRYFDNRAPGCRIRAEHIMASGSLPPAFMPVAIDGASYWDGGIASDTPFQYVIDVRDGSPMTLIDVDLCAADGRMPVNLSTAMARRKDITYSSRMRYNIDRFAEDESRRKAMRKLIDLLPTKSRDNPEVHALAQASRASDIDIIHLVHRAPGYRLDSKDYEFSPRAVREHWDAGRNDMQAMFGKDDRLRRRGVGDGVNIFELENVLPRAA